MGKLISTDSRYSFVHAQTNRHTASVSGHREQHSFSHDTKFHFENRKHNKSNNNSWAEISVRLISNVWEFFIGSEWMAGRTYIRSLRMKRTVSIRPRTRNSGFLSSIGKHINIVSYFVKILLSGLGSDSRVLLHINFIIKFCQQNLSHLNAICTASMSFFVCFIFGSKAKTIMVYH